MGGATFLVQYSQIIEILKIYRPELIIYDIGSNPLDPYYEKGPSLEYLQLFPDNRYLSLARKKHDQLYQISRVFKIIKYNRVASMIAISMLKPDSKNNIDNMLGYRPIYESRLPDLLRQGKINDDVDDHYNRSQLLHNAFVDLMKLVRSHDVNMVFIRSPFYSHDNSVTKLEVDPTVLYEIRRFGFTFYDLSKTNREEFHNAKYYKDFGHLTDQGARIFTNMITPIVKGYLSNNERKMKL